MFSSYYMSLTGHVSPNKMHETDVPVVVISPEDREQVERLTAELRRCFGDTTGVQTALRSLITPPKPDEPTGLGAVVEDDEEHLWTHARRDVSGWVGAHGLWRSWSDITAVKVLSEGVTP